MSADPVIADGRVSPGVAEEHPGLRISWIVHAGQVRRSPRAVRGRLRRMSGRLGGPQAVTMRTQPIPHAYRVFYRHIGLDPDEHGSRTPGEEAAMRRLIEGEFSSHDLVSDAVLIAIVETGVPVWAVDEATIEGPLVLREAFAGERLGTHLHAHELPAGRLVVADDRGVVAVLFGEIADERRPGRDTEEVRVFAIAVEGVPRLHVEEALWACAESLAAG